MRGCALSLGCLGLLLGYAAAGGGIVATITHFAHELHYAAAHPDPENGRDALRRELLRCGRLGPEAGDDAHCQAAWSAERRRFFDYSNSEPPHRSPP